MEPRETGPITIKVEQLRISQVKRDDAAGNLKSVVAVNTKAASTELFRLIALAETGNPLKVTVETDQLAMDMNTQEELAEPTDE